LEASTLSHGKNHCLVKKVRLGQHSVTPQNSYDNEKQLKAVKADPPLLC